MSEIAVLGLRVDASGAIVATENLGRSLNTLGERGEKATSTLSDGFKRLAAAVSAALVIRKFVEETTIAQDAQAQLEAAVRSTGGAAQRSVAQLNAMSGSLQQITTFADDTVTSAQSLLLTFNKIKGNTFDQAALAAANLATRLGGDLRGAAIQVGKALQDPERGITALRRAGVSFSEGQLTLIKRLQETGQLAKAQQLVLGELERQFGGAAVAARNTFGGALKVLANNFGDLFEISKTSAGGVIDFINRLAIFLKVLNDNRGILIDVGKYALIAAGAFAIWAKQAQIVAFWNGIIAGAAAITGFINLARSIGLAAAAMNLFGKVGLLRLVTILAAVASAVLAFFGLKKVLGEFNSEYEKLQKDLKTPLSTGLIQNADLRGPSQTQLDAIKEAKQEQLERLTIARQTLALVGKIGAEEALQVVRNKAINDTLSAQGKLKGEALRITKDTIQEELKLAEQTVLEERAKKLNAENRERAILAKQAYDLVGLEGEALAKLQAEQRALNDTRAAELSLTGSELEARKRIIANELQLSIAGIQYNGILDRRKAKQDELNTKALKILSDQKTAAENFERQFLQTVSSGIEGVLQNGLSSFRDFATSIKTLFIKVFSDILAANVFKRLTTALGSFIPGSQSDLRNVGNANFGSGNTFGGVAGTVVGAAAIGYGVGSRTTNRGLGLASGAATGAALGTVLPGVGNVVGAVVGGIVGGIAGLIGSSNAAKKSAEAAAAAQKVFNQALDAVRNSVQGGSGLEQALRNSAIEFQKLREQAIETFAGKKNEAGRTAALAEINALEALRTQQLREENAELQRRAQTDLRVRELRAKGLDVEADKMAFAEAQHREYIQAVKEGADAATLAQLRQTQLTEAQQFAAEAMKVAAAKVEDARRTLFDLANETLALSDPRRASQERDAEDAARRIFDAVQRGASEAELAALRLYNAALLAAKAAERAENDLRTQESLLGRIAAAKGDTRGAEDIRLAANQRQEIVDAIRDGMSPSNIALLRLAQFSERSQLLMQRNIEDSTKRIQLATDKQIQAIDDQIAVERLLAEAQIKAIDDQISAIQSATTLQVATIDQQIAGIQSLAKGQIEQIDEQIAIGRQQLEAAQTANNLLEKQVRASEALRAFRTSTLLGESSTLNPLQRRDLAQQQFDAAAARARTDTDAAASLPALAQAFLAASRAVNASGQGFVTDERRVLGVIDQLLGVLPSADQLQISQQQLAAAEAGLRALEQQKSDVAAAADKQIAILTAVRDQLTTDAQRQIDLLTSQRDTIVTTSQKQIDKLQEAKEQLRRDAQLQIDQLILLEREAHLSRVKQEELLLALTGGGGGTSEAPTVNLQQEQVAEQRRSNSRLETLLAQQEEELTVLRQQVRVSADAAAQLNARIERLIGSVDTLNDNTRRNREGAQI